MHAEDLGQFAGGQSSDGKRLLPFPAELVVSFSLEALGKGGLTFEGQGPQRAIGQGRAAQRSHWHKAQQIPQHILGKHQNRPAQVGREGGTAMVSQGGSQPQSEWGVNRRCGLGLGMASPSGVEEREVTSEWSGAWHG